MNIIEITDEIASYYPMLDIIRIEGVEIKHLINFDKVYEPIKYLGKGAYGTVQCYRERATGNLYAFKEIEINDQTNIRTLQEEVSILARLSENNRSIVKYQDSFIYMKDDKSIGGRSCVPIYVIVTEYIHGSTLHEFIDNLIKENETVSTETVLSLGIWLLSLIAEIHAVGYVHRDIKPENIMIDYVNRRFMLIDFGLTCSLKRKSSERSKLERLIGTPEFIAPERWVLKKKSRFSFRSSDLSILKKADVWAAGITLYCIIEKKYPWEGRDIYSIGQQIVGPHLIEYTYPNSKIVQIISMMIDRDSQHRPSAIDMVRHMKEFIHECQIHAFQQKRDMMNDPFMTLFYQGHPQSVIELMAASIENDSDSSSSDFDSSDDEELKTADESRHVTFNPIAQILQSIPRLNLEIPKDVPAEMTVLKSPIDSSNDLTVRTPEMVSTIDSRHISPESPRTYISKQQVSPRNSPSPHNNEGIISSRGSPRSFVGRSTPPGSPRKEGMMSLRSATPPGSPHKKISPRTELFSNILRRF